MLMKKTILVDGWANLHVDSSSVWMFLGQIPVHNKGDLPERLDMSGLGRGMPSSFIFMFVFCLRANIWWLSVSDCLNMNRRGSKAYRSIPDEPGWLCRFTQALLSFGIIDYDIMCPRFTNTRGL